MRVTAHVVGGASHDLDLPADATYGDLLAALDASRQEAAVVVDGSPVPGDAPVAAEEVRVLPLVKGG